MMSGQAFIAFIAAVGGFIGGVMWVDASASLELTRTQNEVVNLQKKLNTSEETNRQIKNASGKREEMVKQFVKNYLETK